MIPELRRAYNARFSQARYDAFIRDLDTSVSYPTDFHVCETPLFLSAPLTEKLLCATSEIVSVLRSPQYLAHVEGAIPAGANVPGETPHPLFLQLDFAICRADDRDEALDADAYDDDAFVPRLIELQGFPSLFGFQWLLDLKIRQYFEIDSGLRFYFGEHDAESFTRLLRDAVVADADPKTVILMDVEPEHQKTRIDFACTEHLLGIRSVCLTKVLRRGRQLFYRDDGMGGAGREVPITRIYNRVIFDDLSREPRETQFKFGDDVDVQWAGHPNWFFKISKFSLPLLYEALPDAGYVLPCHFLHELDSYPPNLERYVLKPLYSYSGMGVELDVTLEKLDTIPAPQRSDYILQRQTAYAPLVETPDGYSRAEVRVMLIWPEDYPDPEPVCTLVRMSKGRMMGTRFNRQHTWVGSTLAYHVPVG